MDQFDPSTIAVGGVSILILLPGLVQFLKGAFSLEGKAVTVLSFCLGAVLYVGSQAEFLLPGSGKWVAFVIQALSVGLSASGYFKLVKDFIDRANGGASG
jgi:hypothetical protein